MALVQPAAISQWSTLNDHGLTEQIPRHVFVLTTTDVSVPRKRTSESADARGGYVVNGTVYRFVQVRPERFSVLNGSGWATPVCPSPIWSGRFWKVKDELR